MLATSAFAVAQSAVVPALPALQEQLDISAAGLPWVFTSTLVSGAVLTPVAGRLGDIFGKRRVMLVLLGVTALSLLLAFFASSFAVLLVARVFQGAGAGIFPLAFAIVRDEFPRDRVAGGIGSVASVLGIGTGLAVVAAGLIVDALASRWVFALPLLVVLPALPAVRRWVPPSRIRATGRPTILAGVLLALGLAAILMSITQTAESGWLSAPTLGLLATGAALLALWASVEARARVPLIHLEMLRARGVWTANAVTLAFGAAMFCGYVLIPQLVQQQSGPGMGASAAAGGLFLLPMTVAQIVTAAYAGRVDRRFGSAGPVAAACVLAAFGYAGLAVEHTSPVALCVWSGVIGVAIGISFTALPNVVVQAVRPDQTGVATGVNNVMRIVGGALGTQVAATFLAADLGAAGAPTATAYALAFGSGAAAAVVALALTPLIPRPPRLVTGPANALGDIDSP